MTFIRTRYLALACAAVLVGSVQPAGAQDARPAGPPGVGDLAPDFALPGATMAGPSQTPVRLSDFRGQTVVIAFFPKARTGG